MSATRKPAPSEVYSREEFERDQMGWSGADNAAKLQSGAPLQPAASQPNHDGVSHETENFSQCKSYFHECRCLLSLYHAGRHRDRAGISAICWNDNEATERTFTHSELTTRLERIARLVVQEAAKRMCVYCRRGDKPILGDTGSGRYWHDHEFCEASEIIAIANTQAKLQQLREAVERP